MLQAFNIVIGRGYHRSLASIKDNLSLNLRFKIKCETTWFCSVSLIHFSILMAIKCFLLSKAVTLWHIAGLLSFMQITIATVEDLDIIQNATFHDFLEVSQYKFLFLVWKFVMLFSHFRFNILCVFVWHLIIYTIKIEVITYFMSDFFYLDHPWKNY